MKKKNKKDSFLLEKETWERKLKNKKGAIGATLTWIVAVFIILFILVIFLVLALALSLTKDVTEVKPEASTKIPLLSSVTLTFAMNMPTELNGKQMAMEELISNWALSIGEEKNKIREKIKKEVEEVLKETIQDKECYVFHVEYGLEAIRKSQEEAEKYTARARAVPAATARDIENMQIDFDNLLSEKDPRVSWGPEGQRKGLLERAPFVYIFSDGEKIQVKLYVGRC